MSSYYLCLQIVIIVIDNNGIIVEMGKSMVLK